MYGLPTNLANLFKMYINILPTVQQVAMILLFTGGIAFFLVAIIKLLRSSTTNEPGNYALNCEAQKMGQEEKEMKSIKSPLFNSRDVISDIIDEGKQVIFGKKKVNVQKNNSIYKDTTRRRSSLSNVFGYLTRDSKKGKSKSEIYDKKKLTKDSTVVKLLKSSTDSETDSSSSRNTRNPFFGEENKNFSEAEENLSKFLPAGNISEEDDISPDSGNDFQNFEVDLTMLDSLREDVV